MMWNEIGEMVNTDDLNGLQGRAGHASIQLNKRCDISCHGRTMNTIGSSLIYLSFLFTFLKREQKMKLKPPSNPHRIAHIVSLVGCFIRFKTTASSPYYFCPSVVHPRAVPSEHTSKLHRANT